VHKFPLFDVYPNVPALPSRFEKDKITCFKLTEIDPFSLVDLMLCTARKGTVKDGFIALIGKARTVYAALAQSPVLVRCSSPFVILAIEFFNG